MNLWCLLTLVILQGKSSTEEQKHASSMYLVLQKSHYYLKCQVTSTRFKPWVFTGQVLDQNIFLHLLFDVCEPSLGYLVETVGLLWTLISSCNTTACRTNYHSTIKQLIYDFAGWGLLFLSRTETSWVIYNKLKKKKNSEGCVYTASSTWNLIVYPFWCTPENNIIWGLYYPCLVSTVLCLRSAHDLKRKKVCPMWIRMRFLWLW